MEAVAPVPVRASVLVEGDALLVTVSVAFTTPVVCGLKVIVKGTLWPAEIVTGNEIPPTVKTELLVVAAVTVTFAPLAVNWPDAEPLLPSVTVPTLRVEGDTLSVPTAAVPVPDKETDNVGLEAFEVTVTLPVVAPEVVGANLTVNVALWPAVNVNDELIPLRVNPVPLIETFETETLEPPVFVIVLERD